MRISSRWSWFKSVAIVVLLLSGGRLAAQSADQSFKTIPQQVKESGETKATTKTNTISNNAMSQLDSASNKAFKGFTNMFKKKKKKPATDSTALHTADTTAAPPKPAGALP